MKSLRTSAGALRPQWRSGSRSAVIASAAASVVQFHPLESRCMMAATLPDGFAESTFIEGLNGATSMELAPDGRIFVSEKFGAIKIVKNGQLLDTPFLTLDVDTFRDRGISGIELDPNFETNGYVYVHYTKAVPTNRDVANNGAVNRVSRFTANGDVVLAGSERVLIDNVPSSTAFHCGGFLDFGNDGKLYIGFGTPDVNDGAQDLSTYIGKILRINPDGSVPSDNPFVGQAGARGAIWAVGLRNPFSGAVDPVTGKIYVNDVGEANWEEINEVQKGKNYGWPNAEGNSSNPAYTNPVYAYGHIAEFEGEAAVTGGTFYRGDTWPSQYAGDYFFADYDQGYLRVRDSATGQVSLFGEGLFRPVDLDMAADGNIYYLSVWGGTIQKISYVGNVNRAPHAVASANPTSGTRPLLVHFSGEGSSDPDGDTLNYTWDFGDGTSAVGKTLEHTYSENGQYLVTLTVSDGRGGADVSSPITITVGNEAPVARITSPTLGATYNGGTTISFGGTGSDAEDGTLPASAFEWKIDFHHNTHTHGFIESIPGVGSGSFLIPATGEVAADQWYRIYLTVTDSAGLKSTTYVDVMPNVSNIVLNTNIPGLSLNLDNQPKGAPHSFEGVVGMTRLLGAPLQQIINGKIYEFVSWSDGGAASHDITTPSANTTYTANYREVTGLLIQAEDFDSGAANVAYRDTDSRNQGGAYRNTAVDIQATTDLDGGYNVGWTRATEWLRYTIDVPASGTYTLDARVASKVLGGTLHVEIDGVNVTGAMRIPNTGAWQTFTTISKTGINLTAGTHTMRVVVDSHSSTTGTAGNFNWFRLVQSASAPANQKPVVAISSPGNNQQFNAGDDLVIVAQASDSDGSIAKVEFFVDGKYVGADSAGVYDTTWENMTAGSHVITAVAYDNQGAATTSAPITIDVASTGNRLPVVSISSPGNGQQFSQGADLLIVAQASDSDGSIAKVEFFVDGRYVGADSAGVYDTVWENMTAGSHVITAVAYDNLGATATSAPITISAASAANQPPVVSITSHTNGQTLNAGTTQVIVASASDPDGTVSKVEFYVDGALIGTDTGGDFDNDWLSIPAGQHVLTARAYDNAGAFTTSAPITVNVVSTQSGQSPFSGTPITLPGVIQAEDFDNGGQGVAYNDIDTTNYNSPFRSDTRVDIEATTDAGGGYSVGHVKAGEWLEYTVTIATSGTYAFDARVSSKAAGGTFHMELNGVNVTGAMTVPNTGAWATYQTISKTGLNLTAGTYVMRIAMDTNSASTAYVGNFNWFRLVAQ